jgi:hypothetical protein
MTTLTPTIGLSCVLSLSGRHATRYATSMPLRHEVARSEWGGGKAALRRVSARLFPSPTRVAGNCGV